MGNATDEIVQTHHFFAPGPMSFLCSDLMAQSRVVLLHQSDSQSEDHAAKHDTATRLSEHGIHEVAGQTPAKGVS